MANDELNETYTPPTADGAQLIFRPDLGADVYVHPQTKLMYLDLGEGRYQRTERRVDEAPPAVDPGADFPTERPRGAAKYGVDLSVEGYA